MKINRSTWILAVFMLVALIWIGKLFREEFYLWENRLEVHVDTPVLSLPLAQYDEFGTLSPEIIPNIQEYLLLSPDEDDSEVVAISESFERDVLLVLNSNDMDKWDLVNKRITSTTKLLSSNKAGAQFSEDGTWLLTAGKVDSDSLVIGYQLINTMSGEIGECFAASDCPGEQFTHVENQLLSPNAQILIRYDTNGGIQIPVLEWGKKLGRTQILVGDCSYEEKFDLDLHKMTISPSQEYIAYIFETGEICVREFEEFSWINQKTGDELPNADGVQPAFNSLRFDIRKDKEGRVIVYDFKFDPTNRWLGILTYRELLVFDLQASYFSNPIIINDVVQDGSTIAFDRTGKILVLGTANKLSFYNLSDGIVISTLEIPPVTSLYFTRDNKLLIWGDVYGDLHMWGVR